jgi:hypothetical protein
MGIWAMGIWAMGIWAMGIWAMGIWAMGFWNAASSWWHEEKEKAKHEPSPGGVMTLGSD